MMPGTGALPGADTLVAGTCRPVPAVPGAGAEPVAGQPLTVTPHAPGPETAVPAGRPRSAGWAAANRQRVATAAIFSAGNVQEAMQALGPDAPQHLREAGELRVTHPGESLAELAARAGCTKHTLAGRLRRLLLKAAGLAAGETAAPAARPGPQPAF